MIIMHNKTPLLQKCRAAIVQLSLVLMLGSCNKNMDYFVPDAGQATGADTNWVNNITTTMPVAVLKNTLLLKPYTDSIDLQKNDTVKNATGLMCAVLANSLLDSMDQIATGKAMIEMMIVSKKGDFIRMDKPTMSESTVLESSDAINVSIIKAGSYLKVAPTKKLSLQVYHPSFTTFNKLYFGEINSNGEFNWLADTSGGRNNIEPDNFGYNINTNRLNWMTASKPLESLVFTNITLLLPAQYTNANTTAYLVYNDTKSVANLYGNTDTKKFVGTRLPGGKAAAVVVLSKQGNDYYAAFKPVTISGDIGSIVNQTVTVLPTKITIEAMQQLLNAL